MPDRPLASALPEPDRVSEAMIARCRDEVEGRGKALVRRLLLPCYLAAAWPGQTAASSLPAACVVLSSPAPPSTV